MKICIEQFLGQNHSWSICGQNIARALIKKNHEVHLKSTNGYDLFPLDLKPYINEKLDNNYDIQISYTAMHNFSKYLSHGNKNRFGIWNYESTILPVGMAKHYKSTDKLLPSSKFMESIYINNGVPKEHMVVVPHGINVEEYSSKEIYKLNTKKKYKILANIAQPHIRKNIDGLFEAFGKAFTKNDDVCLVVKINVSKPINGQRSFVVDFWDIYNTFCKQYPNHADVEIITKFLDSMVPLYNACDIVFSMTHCEAWWLPGTEGMATNNLIIAPNWGGQLEYMNKDNSLLIEGKEIRAPKKMQYWTPSPYAKTFEPDINDAVNKLKLAINNYDDLMNKFRPGMKEQITRLTWDKTGEQIIGLVQ